MTWYHINKNSEVSTCSQEQVEEYLQTFSSDMTSSEPARLKNTQETYCSPDSKTESCHPSQSGTMSAHLTVTPGGDQLTFFAEDSPAKTLVRQVKEQELAESVRDYGRNMRDSLERCGLNLSLPKTHLCFALGDLELSSKTWPRWGIMLDGECSELGMSVRHISETECGCLPGGAMIPTPVASDGTTGAIIGKNDVFYTTKTGMPRKINQKGTNGSVGLARLVQMWPTPAARDFRELGGTQTQQNWPTPCASEERDTGTNWESLKRLDKGGRICRRMATLGTPETKTTKSAQLNPSWVEWLMGWPIGFTDLKPLVTVKHRNVQLWHSLFSQKD